MANYSVTIINGQGTQAMKEGVYNVTATAANGYDLTSLLPTTYTATDSAGSADFTLSASGTLNFIVNETGAQGGTPVTSGTIVMTDSTGTEQYGSVVNISATGEAVFSNVPYGAVGAPFTLYFKQLTTDDNHNIYSGVITVSMTSDTQTEYVLNSAIATQTFTLEDANYSGLKIDNATLNFASNE